MEHPRYLTFLLSTLLLFSPALAQAQGSARADVESLVNTLFVATDAKDWSTVRSLFLDEIDVDFSSLGSEPGRIPADDLVAGWESGLHAQKESHHMTSNHQVALQENAGEVTAQGYAYNRLLESAGNGFWEVWGTYTLPVTRTEGGWRFSGITFEAKHTAGDPAVPAHTLE